MMEVRAISPANLTPRNLRELYEWVPAPETDGIYAVVSGLPLYHLEKSDKNQIGDEILLKPETGLVAVFRKEAKGDVIAGQRSLLYFKNSSYIYEAQDSAECGGFNISEPRTAIHVLHAYEPNQNVVLSSSVPDHDLFIVMGEAINNKKARGYTKQIREFIAKPYSERFTQEMK